MEPLAAFSVLILFVVIRFVIPVAVLFSLAKALDHFIPAN